MSKVIKKENYSIVIIPKTDIYGISLSESTQERDRKEMVEQIKRHVDNVHDVYIDCDTYEACSFCGYNWEVDETGAPLCCTKAINEYNEQKITA